ncbi:MAG: hypothetical protein OHK0039_35850 [Bacteroidia bacterium]
MNQPPLRRIVGIATLCIGIVACKQQPTDQTTTGDRADTTQAQVAADSQGTRTRGLGAELRLADFDFARDLPTLYTLVRDDAAMRNELEAYARQVLLPGSVRSETDILALMQTREEKIIPHLQPFLENLDQDIWYEGGEKLFDELSRIGIDIQTAEGMFIGLGPAAMLQDAIAQYGSEALRWYVRFLNAESQASSGEYPYLNTDAFAEMVLCGEKLQDLRSNAYFAKIEPAYYNAVSVLTDIHLVYSPGNRQAEDKMVLVGGTHTEAYPYMTGLEAREAFAGNRGASRFAGVMGRILENPSEISSEPGDIYAVVLDWMSEEEQAQRQVYTYLSTGKDVPHYLKIRRGNGQDSYAVVYRFYESADQADAALRKITATFPRAELVMLSVQGDGLFQLGPG